ncbi:carboxymuconolactone decarboxylase family protein [Trujillonella endophytica]|uniref:Alkylhydroperoxidase family enzyme, contains CxxC motif n=1 Tax=Trujillonella endophytica TaxID=673521 RepID=A0A1H8UQ09_9ACTN|nr:carboxymuconolactone decarboxylase family protein [Trujillella endophytica]SEP05299.1 Alkylhydroperoxidase family enzyme, contains CxxC motif [Trujillella endophytica]
MSDGRIPPLPAEEWDADVLDALSVLRPPRKPRPPAENGAPAEPAPPDSAPPRESTPARRGAGTSNLIGVLSHHPALMKSWFVFNNHLFRSTLTDRVREMITVRTAWLRRSEYEWAQHVRMARTAGMSDDEIAALDVGPDAPLWGSVDALVLRAVDQLCENRRIGDDVWAALCEHFDRRQMMDIVFTVAAYDALGMALENFDVELDAGAEGFPAERIP